MWKMISRAAPGRRIWVGWSGVGDRYAQRSVNSARRRSPRPAATRPAPRPVPRCRGQVRRCRGHGRSPGKSRVSSVAPARGAGQGKETTMSLYLDIHTIPGVTSAAAAGAHAADLQTQDKFGVRYLRYWVNEPEGKVFCLIEAPSAEAATAVHKEAHGLLADELFAVEEGV